MLERRDCNAARLNDASANVVAAPAAAPAEAIRAPRPRAPRGRFTQSAGRREGRGSLLGEHVERSELHEIIIHGSVAELQTCVQNATDFTVDEEGDSPLAFAAQVGRLGHASAMLSVPACRAAYLNRTNTDGQTPIELACLRGHWKMLQLLHNAGGTVPRHNEQQLLDKVLKRQFYRTAGCIAALGIGHVTLEALQGQVPAETLQWVIEQMAAVDLESAENKELYLRRAIENGMTGTHRMLQSNGMCANHCAVL